MLTFTRRKEGITIKKKIVWVLFHIISVLIAIVIFWLILIKIERVSVLLSAYFACFVFAAIALTRLHYKLYRVNHVVRQYDEDYVNQKRMLHLQETMLELSSYMTKVNSLKELLDIILRKAIEVIPEAQFGSILVMNQEGMLEFKAIYGFGQELYKVTLNPEECFQWRVTSGNFVGPIIIQDLSEFSRDFMTKGTYDRMMELDALNTKSSMSAPLLIDGQFFGSINIDSTETNVFKEEHKKLMAYFADQATIAIKNHKYYERVSFLSKYDSLTGAMNRQYFQEKAEILLKEKNQNRSPITFVIMDLNNFKKINDQYGHNYGDSMLTFFAESFSAQLSQADFFVRYGGDEFVAVFMNSDTGSTTQKMNSIYDNITKKSARLTPDGRELFCRFSYGMAEFPKEETQLKSLIHLADQRMYKHKNSSRSIDKNEALNFQI